MKLQFAAYGGRPVAGLAGRPVLGNSVAELAKLLKRVVDLDMEHCPNCGGDLKIIAAILEQPVTEKILTHPGLTAGAPPRAPARGQALQAA